MTKKILREVYLDMDGVIANFNLCLEKTFKVKSYLEVLDSDQRTIKEETISQMIGSDFFLKIEKFPNANKLINLVQKYSGNGYSILSAPLEKDEKHVANLKRIWIKKHLINNLPKKIFIESKKHLYAVKIQGNQKIANVLIDDYKKKCDLFRKAGGIAIQYDASKNSLNYLEQELSKIF